MSSELRELYQEVILDHNKNPRNYQELEGATHTAEGYNPLCGDKVKIFLRIVDNVVEDVAFLGDGCAISTASASLLTQAIKGKGRQDVETLFGKFRDMLTQDSTDRQQIDGLGKLAVFEGVCEYPARVKCATLCWHTLQAALDKADVPVTTE